MTRREAVAVFALCAVPRLVWLPFAPEPFDSDYLIIGNAIASGTTAALTAWQRSLEPVFPMFLAAFQGMLPRQLAQIVVVSLGCVCLFALTGRLTGSRRAAAATAVLFSFHPYLLWQSVTFNGTPFAAALLAMALLAHDGGDRVSRAALAGALFGVLAATRASFAPLIVCGAAVLARRSGWRAAVAFAGAAVLVVTPWVAATWQRDGGLLPSRSGLNLYLSACEYGRWIPEYDLDVVVIATFDRLEPTVGSLPPARAVRERDRLLLTEAAACAAADPAGFVAGVVRRGALTFSPRLMPVHPRGIDSEAVRVGDRLELRAMPEHPPLAQWTHTIATAMLILASVVGIASRRIERPAMLYLSLAVFVVTNGFFMVSTRLAFFAYVVLMVFAGAALARPRR
jgi:hypothetical protein